MSPQQDLAAIENMVRSAADAAYRFVDRKQVEEREVRQTMRQSCKGVFNREMVSDGAGPLLTETLKQALAQMVIEKSEGLFSGNKGDLSPKEEFYAFSTDVVLAAKEIAAPVKTEMMLIRKAEEIKARHTVMMEGDMNRLSDIVTEASRQEDETSALATFRDLMARALKDFENEVSETVVNNAKDILIDMFYERSTSPGDELKNSYAPEVAGAKAVIGWETFLNTSKVGPANETQFVPKFLG